MKMRMAICLIFITAIITSVPVSAYDFETNPAITSMADEVLSRQKAVLESVGADSLGFDSTVDIESLKISKMIPMIELNMTSVYLSADKDYLKYSQRFIPAAFDGVAREKVDRLSELNLMNTGTSLWFVLLDSDSSSAKSVHASMIVMTDSEGKMTLRSMTGPGDYFDVFLSALTYIDELAREKGPVSSTMLFVCEDRYLFAATVDNQEWVLPVPNAYEINYDDLSGWHPDRLWTVDEVVQAYKSNMLANKAVWEENGQVVKMGGGVDLSHSPEIADNNPRWYLILIFAGLLVVAVTCILVLMRRRAAAIRRNSARNRKKVG